MNLHGFSQSQGRWREMRIVSSSLAVVLVLTIPSHFLRPASCPRMSSSLLVASRILMLKPLGICVRAHRLAMCPCQGPHESARHRSGHKPTLVIVVDKDDSVSTLDNTYIIWNIGQTSKENRREGERKRAKDRKDRNVKRKPARVERTWRTRTRD